MPIPPHVERKLQGVLGSETAEDSVRWIGENESVRADIAELRHDMQVGLAKLETQIERSKADLMKWSFVFWVGAVTAIAVLAGVLRA